MGGGSIAFRDEEGPQRLKPVCPVCNVGRRTVPERVQQGQCLVPNPVPEVIRFGVGSIFPVSHVPGAARFGELSSSQGEKRTEQPAFCIHSGHGGESERIGRPHEVKQNRFRLIVAVMGRDNVCRAALAVAGFGAQPFEMGITDFPGFGLHTVLGLSLIHI